MNIYSVILYIVHLLIRTVLGLCSFAYHVKCFIQCQTGLGPPIDQRTLLHAAEDKKFLKRLPHHVGLLIAEENVSYHDISKIIAWSIALGIYCISIYDHKGTIKSNHSKLYKEIITTHQQLFGTKQQYSITFKGIAENGSNGGSNGTTSSKVVIHLLSRKDGKQNVAQGARRLSTLINMKKLPSGDITTEVLDDFLAAAHGESDPELLVRFGTVMCTLGYPPWQIRLTEILSLPTHRNISYEAYRGILQQYTCLEQRVGK